MSRLIAIDPGKHKCGLVLVNQSLQSVIDAKVARTASTIHLINSWESEASVDLIIIGNGTSSNSLNLEINSELNIPTIFQEEKNTTLRARDRYWDIWPKNFFLRLLPDGMVLPSENLDALAALILAEDFLNVKLTWSVQTSFKIWPE
ncbi:resolvase [Prochlorococcus sp. MIT 1223]|uniref:resolvase n=1 Tax=Prochlorococcus sp. MIT 1223 TaxID=3096217 RepID=UPI002A753C68|nr:resolvase [Prochlorococcus sp. MIT 1223]